MTIRALLGLAFSTCLVACLAKTTSLGGTSDAIDGKDASDNDGGAASSSSSGGSSGSSGGIDAGSAGSGVTCQVPYPKLTVAPPPCPTGEYCKSDDGTCGGAAHCVTRPSPPPPFCPDLECGCDGDVRCRDTSRSGGTDVGPKAPCSITCGPKTCDGVDEYCWHGSGGVFNPDGGANTMYECRPVPAACRIDHSCTCLLANGGSGGQCTESGGKLDLNVPLP